MSTLDPKNNCQQILTTMKSILENASRARLTAPKADSLRTYHISQDQLLALCATINNQIDKPIVLIANAKLQLSAQYTSTLNQLSNLFNVNQTWHIIEGELSEQEINGDVASHLTQTQHFLLQKVPGHNYVIPEAFLNLPIPNPSSYQAMSLQLHQGEQYPLNKLIAHLSHHGYIRTSQALESGSFTVHGEQLILISPTLTTPQTITFNGNTIETITSRQPIKQSSSFPATIRTKVTAHPSLTIWPASFPLPQQPLSSLLSDTCLILPSYLTPPSCHQLLFYNTTNHETEPPFNHNQGLHPKLNLILYENREHVEEYLRDQTAPYILCASPASNVSLNLHSQNFAIISERYLFPPTPHSRPIARRQAEPLIAQLKIGRPAVHSDHGIGIFEGLKTRTINHQTREYLILRYAAGDALSVPVEYAHKITAYLGDTAPPLNRLGGVAWAKTKKKASLDAERFAKDILQIAQKRTNTTGHYYLIDEKIEHELEESFPYTLTPGQWQAWEDVKDDMLSSKPIDRLIVGDVGFGKTEIAIRAARHAVANGYQVAILAPTTLLVQQHANTLLSRLPTLKGGFAILSRFTAPTQTRRLRTEIAANKKQIVIGTHALLSQKTTWSNLGLVIIDEEQRFGVKHKEYFKQIRANIDVISLSATPIPRTLSMALTGLKDLSVISSPPPGRQDVLTIVTKDTDAVITKAIQDELKRGGQTYVVAPKIRQLSSLVHRLRQLNPNATIDVIHGQLSSIELATRMNKFDSGQLDVLVSSTIIENGLDIPSANTIIVTHATHFGLSDLYQLRGRIGRRQTQGHAYFVYNQQDLSIVQRQRLAALTEASRLGSGWTLAERDLEIRGAGNLLGAQQSGSVNNIGIQLYLDLVHEAIQDQNESVPIHDVDISLPQESYIPSTYIADLTDRSHTYHLIARCRTLEQLNQIRQTITDHYGTPPAQVTNLYQLVKLQQIAAHHGITEIGYETISPSDEDPYSRIIIKSDQLPKTLRQLTQLGNWIVKKNSLTLDLDTIDEHLIQKLMKHLSAKLT